MDDIKTVKGLPFSGKKSEFRIWSFRFLASIAHYECKAILTDPNCVSPADTEDLTSAAALALPSIDEKIANRKANKKAYMLLTLSISPNDNITYDAIQTAVTIDLPNGCAKTAWQNLSDIYQPATKTEQHELEQQFSRCELKEASENPDKWFSKLENLRIQLKQDHNIIIDDDKMRTQILFNTKPEIYSTIISILKRDMNKGILISLTEIKLEYRQVFSTQKVTPRSRETALMVQKKYPKVFKGDCRHCGKKGHKGADCWTKEENKEKRPSTWQKKGKETANMVKQMKTVYHCDYCNKDGHTEDRCFKKKKEKEGSQETVMCFIETALLVAAKLEGKINDFTFVADTGASSHMVYNDKYLTDITEITDEYITAANAIEFPITKKGTYRGYGFDHKNNKILFTLEDVLCVPKLGVNLLSITKCTSNPNLSFQSNSKGSILKFQREGRFMKFDIKLEHGTGILYATNLVPYEKETANLVMNFSKLHSLLGHPNDATLKQTAKHNGFTLVNVPEGPCKYCVKAKIRMKNMPKLATNPSTRKLERLMIDISYIKSHSLGQNNYWLLMMDEYTHLLWSFFIPKKNLVSKTLLPILILLEKEHDLKIKFIRSDNAPEHVELQQDITEHPTLSAKFEFTAPDSPQQNGRIERKFATLNGKCRAMLNAAEFNEEIRKKMWAYCAYHSTLLDNLLIRKDTIQSPWKMFYGVENEIILNLQPFGNMCIVKANEKIKSKLTNRGFPAIYIGPASDHKAGVNRFYNYKTESTLLSRNYVALNQTYGHYYRLNKQDICILEKEINKDLSYYNNDNLQGEEEDDYIEIVTQDLDTPSVTFNEANFIEQDTENSTLFSNESEDMDDELTSNFEQDLEIMIADQEAEEREYNLPRNVARRLNLPREVLNLDTFYNRIGSLLESDEESNTSTVTMDDLGERALLTIFNPRGGEVALLATVYDGSPEPKTFKESLECHDSPNWWVAIKTEFRNMEEKGVWQIKTKTSVPPNRKLIGARWVLARKDDGRYRARCVAKGFSQIPGKDFQENHAPVVSDTTLHLLMVIKTMLKLEAGQFDIETAFLYGELEEELWMEIPEGYPKYLLEIHNKVIDPKTHCLLLTKAIYGLVQAARQWWKKFKEVLLGLGYKASRADPCLFIKQDPNDDQRRSYLIIYVDDGGIFSTAHEVKEIIKALSKTFVVKDLGKMETFVGCQIIENDKRDTIWLHQPKLLKHLKEQFGELVSKVKPVTTPAAPRTIIVRPEKGDTLISATDQSKFRSGVGMLLYLVKHSRLDIANAVRELSKVADGANHAHWKALLRTIKYVICTENLALKLKPNLQTQGAQFHLSGISDSDYAGDRATRTSVYGYVIYFCGAPIAWKSKAGKSVTLSSTEAEYFALSEVTKEIIFVKQVLETMGINLVLPILVKVDNVGAIYLSNNYSLSQRTKHIDIRRHFVREFVQDGILKTIFVPTDENEADMHTKNTPEEIFLKHRDKNMEDITHVLKKKNTI
jgi:Reverse transcriptase (RNA-dependent DNA polymerase)